MSANTSMSPGPALKVSTCAGLKGPRSRRTAVRAAASAVINPYGAAMPPAAGPTPAVPPAAGPASAPAAAKASRTARARALVASPPRPDVQLALHVVSPVTCACPSAMHEREGPSGVAYVIALITPPVLQPRSYESLA
jgi:hypothetical protein